MIFTAIKFVRVASKVATVAWAAKTGYNMYKTGTKAYGAYKRVKGVTDTARNAVKKLTK
jgi:hypothetical protein